MGAGPNILLIAIDSLRADRMSGYGYGRLTTPHIDRFARGATLFENTIAAHIPTTSSYASMLTGRDCFGTQVVALRHRGGLRTDIRTMPEILAAEGYATACVGFTGNPASRGFERYLDYEAWGCWKEGRSPKAENLNKVAVPEIERLAKSGRPFFVMLRHMDPHAPYLPPEPFERMFYHGDECDPANRSMEPVMNFKPFADFFRTWMPPGISDKAYVEAQYDGAVAYMDSCIQVLFTQLESLGILDDTIVVLNSDHGETLYEHDCWFDHHGLYETNLRVPLIIRWPEKLPAGKRIAGCNQHKDLVPTLLDLTGISVGDRFDGRSLVTLANGDPGAGEEGIYLTECTWMRKHGWRTPEWKLIVALEPDFHFKPEVELYRLANDPGEIRNLASEEAGTVARLRTEMEEFIGAREREAGLANPIYNQPGWHNCPGVDYFTTSQEAYDSLHIGDVNEARRLQAKKR